MRKHRAVVAQDLRVDAAAYAALADASPCGASDAATAAPRHPGCSPLMPAAVDRVAATDGPATGPSPASPPFSDAA